MSKRSFSTKNIYKPEVERVRGRNRVKYRLVGQKSSGRSFNRGRLTFSKSQVNYDDRGNVAGGKDSNFSFNIFYLVFGVLLCLALFSFLNSRFNITGTFEPKTLQSFLEMLSNVPDVSVPILQWVKLTTGITIVPGLDMIIRFGLVVVTGLVQSLLFIGYIFAWVIV